MSESTREIAGSKADDEFREWYSKSHPFDWWAKWQHGDPLPNLEQLCVRELCRRAYVAAAIRGED